MYEHCPPDDRVYTLWRRIMIAQHQSNSPNIRANPSWGKVVPTTLIQKARCPSHTISQSVVKEAASLGNPPVVEKRECEFQQGTRPLSRATSCSPACSDVLACADDLSLPFLRLPEAGTWGERGWQPVLCSRSVHTTMLCSRYNKGCILKERADV